MRSEPGWGSRREPAGSWTRQLEATPTASDSPLPRYLPKPHSSSASSPRPPRYCPLCSFSNAPPSAGRRKRNLRMLETRCPWNGAGHCHLAAWGNPTQVWCQVQETVTEQTAGFPGKKWRSLVQSLGPLQEILIEFYTDTIQGFLEVKWSEVIQSCLTLCDPMDCSLSRSSVHGILQARILEWVAISFSRGSSQPRDWTRVSRIAGGRFTIWATREAQDFLEFSQIQNNSFVYVCVSLCVCADIAPLMWKEVKIFKMNLYEYPVHHGKFYFQKAGSLNWMFWITLSFWFGSKTALSLSRCFQVVLKQRKQHSMLER